VISPIQSFLTEFRPLAGSPILHAPAANGAEVAAAETAADRAAEMDAACRAAAETARREAAEEAAKTLAAQAERHVSLLADERRRWAEAEGAALAIAVQQGLVELEERVSSGVADVLAPLLPQAATNRARAELARAVSALLANNAEAVIRISGPADLLGALQHGLGERPGAVFVTETGPDVTVLAGATRIQTQLAAWVGALQAELESAA
jgi:hypothetical protein